MSDFNNPWVITIIGGVIVFVISMIIKKFSNKKQKNGENKTSNIYGWKNSNLSNSDDNTIIKSDVTNGDNYVNINIHERNKNLELGNNLDLSELKKIVNILFIDDDTDFKIVSILKKQGWINTKIISDIMDLDKFSNIDIFFVDINGVGIKLQLKYQGMDLAHCIKQKYKDKKVVIYSTDTNRDISHPIIKEADGILPKDAQIYQFSDYIEQFAKEKKL